MLGAARAVDMEGVDMPGAVTGVVLDGVARAGGVDVLGALFASEGGAFGVLAGGVDIGESESDML